MTMWLEAIGALLVGATGVAIGKWFARRKDLKWLLGYFIPLGSLVWLRLAGIYRNLS